MSTKTPAKGHTTKHVHHKKHQQHHKKHHPVKHKQAAAKAPGHNVHTVAKPAAHAKPRGYAVGDLLPVCAFEAVAMSLRLAGQRVTDDDVADLWRLYGELSIPGAAEALGVTVALAANRPVRLPPFSAPHARAGLPPGLAPAMAGTLPPWAGGAVRAPQQFLILGIDVPGPHCVLATADGWWSWGELHDPWPARIEEAWAVSWQ